MTIFLMPNLVCLNATENSCITKANHINEEAIPEIASLIPMLVSNLARNTSVTCNKSYILPYIEPYMPLLNACN